MSLQHIRFVSKTYLHGMIFVCADGGAEAPPCLKVFHPCRNDPGAVALITTPAILSQWPGVVAPLFELTPT